MLKRCLAGAALNAPVFERCMRIPGRRMTKLGENLRRHFSENAGKALAKDLRSGTVINYEDNVVVIDTVHRSMQGRGTASFTFDARNIQTNNKVGIRKRTRAKGLILLVSCPLKIYAANTTTRIQR